MRIEYEGLALAIAPASTDACTISKIHGFKVAANDRFLQLHNTKTTPAAAAVPLRVWQIFGTAPFGEGFIEDDITCSEGATFVVSTTANTYTASAETVDIFVSGDGALDDTSTSIAGDYTTAAETQLVWADGSPAKLVRLEVSDAATSAGPCFVQIHAGDTPETNKIVASFPLDFEGTLDKFFGAGISPSRMVSQAVFDGCTIALSSTQNTYTAFGANVDYIRATYRS